jgi:ABC-2 type transport system ATP-binding protein
MASAPSRPAWVKGAAVTTSVAELDSVTHRYGSIAALSGVSLSLHAEQVTAVLGPNGAGKTTAVGLLTGLLRPTEGRARLFGGDPQSLPARRRIGVMLQVSKVPETLTVHEHLTLFSSYYPAPLPLGWLLDLTALTDVAGRRFGQLSGGQQQRVLFALAVCGNPELLFMDEPTVGMDVESRRTFWNAVRAFTAAGRAVLLTTHYLEEADALASRVVLLSRGRIVADGTPAAIKQQAAGRQVRCRTSLPLAALTALAGVVRAAPEGAGVVLTTTDADLTLRALLAADPLAADLDVKSAGLEEAFVALTSQPAPALAR